MKINKRQLILSTLVCIWAATALAPMAFNAATVQILVVASLIGILIWENLPASITRSFVADWPSRRQLTAVGPEALAGDEELAQFKAELKNQPVSVARVGFRRTVCGTISPLTPFKFSLIRSRVELRTCLG